MNAKEKHFLETLYAFYEKEGRHTLPWRRTRDVYKILVSEIMLQQTQVSRVLPKYKEWLQKFADIQTLAHADQKDVLLCWQGLGYNRRGKFLYESAVILSKKYKKNIPKSISVEELESLPGVGHYTASAVKTFSSNSPLIFIETNIRTVYLYHFFRNKEGVTDRDILACIERTIDKDNPRRFYSALMDYGSYLKKSGVKNNSKSLHYRKQTPFEGSKRQIQSAIVRLLLRSPGRGMTVEEIVMSIQKDEARVAEKLETLMKQGFIQQKNGIYSIVNT